MSLILSRRDLNFLLYEWLDVGRLTAIPRYADHSRETFDAALDTCERIATDLFAPHNKKNDQHEPQFDGETVTIIPEVKTALKAFCDAGLMAAGQDYELGGMQLPLVVEKAGFAWFKGANVGTSAYPFLTIGNANLLLAHGSAAQIDAFVKPELEGRFFGTMCLSEPQAGSSLSDVATRADFECDSPLGGQYRLRGNKMWISGGEHELSENIVHLVLAKIPGPDGKLIPGVKGISLFVVPKYLVNADGSRGEHNDVVLAGLNHKMGYRGTTNCLLNFGEGTKYTPGGRAGAIGYLVGEPHRGLAAMFHMMNEARIGVGLGATMLGYTGYLHALDYARNRPQGRPDGAAGKDPASVQVRLVEHADVRRMLLAQKSYVEGALALNLYCAKLVDESRAPGDADAQHALTLLLDLLTPIAKSWPSQWCLAANDLAIQVHGGYGYTREYNVEQFYRDNRLNPIHEGTHGIQGLDLLGRKVLVEDSAALRLLAGRIQATIDRALALDDAAQQTQAQALAQAVRRLADVTRRLWSADDPAVTLANASVYLEAFGHVVLAWIWLEQALAALAALPAASDTDADFYRGKLAAAQYFFAWELPKTAQQFDLLASLDRTTLEMRDQWF
ncbi:acyl-CoA dehydrogenase [Paraburkholderia caballeronis]|uniref:acyl-CoA dehydrogenase n=1 Tax=Paraburkholderia caballeronis TaxID=416943 RepID=UPI001065AD8A|nr:acyl-CoA dehydrogenase [Paraburkholderia caballeronis]TDV11778.1 alkylation response protein AidB-like acyl-CoA dehydrogenase [Paraburkholderia caballeronis]TDV14859.1 alkylation response protein AidB-like acyl-CoA dehydrogenase [Paraburkholderia caballeronis]TDV23979.1 alkylation response protein AidB-like acyl-CoA dehydrogenase [Paraburkholderia caballeronis]